MAGMKYLGEEHAADVQRARQRRTPAESAARAAKTRGSITHLKGADVRLARSANDGRYAKGRAAAHCRTGDRRVLESSDRRTPQGVWLINRRTSNK